MHWIDAIIRLAYRKPWISERFTQMRSLLKVAAGTVLAALCLVPATSASAAASPTPTQTTTQSSGLPSAALPVATQMSQFLTQHPDAHRVDATTVGWGDNSVELVFSQTTAANGSASRSQATAATQPGSCDFPYFCIFESSNFNGRKLQFSSCGVVQDVYVYGFNDMTSSVINTRQAGAFLNDNSNGTGPNFFVPRNTRSAAIPTFNDRTSSVFLRCSD